jgi:hypothetical protein
MEFAASFPEEWKEWYRTSNSVICLNVPNELKLIELSLKLKEKGIRFAEFREPDIGNELTAISIVPGPDVKKACSGLPLAGKRVNEGAPERLKRKFEVAEAMENTQQTSGQNMLQHGGSVKEHLLDLLQFLRDPHYSYQKQWRFPQWLMAYGKKLQEKLPPDHILEKYALWHDCGKPFCREVDAEGKIHYPNHAKVSAQIFRELYPEQKEVARLIEMDMDLHCLSAKEAEEFSKRPEAAALLLAGLAEVHSNAALFGGINADSFKIKWKHLERRGLAICRYLFS